MNRFDRALAILLLLRSGKTLSAPDLARRLGVSTRTIYRDIETLGEVGVPVYAEVGREGGFRLIEGYFLPPIAFTVGEASSLLTGIALLDRLRAKPFAAELDMATHKLMAVVPESLRTVLSHAPRVIGFEAIPDDIFHPERTQGSRSHESALAQNRGEAQALTVFLKGIYDKQAVALDYVSPYGGTRYRDHAAPYGILWDRDRWYLIGQQLGGSEKMRFWRADRVMSIALYPQPVAHPEGFSIENLLNRQWLDEAMTEWAKMSPVVIRMTRAQAERLKRDWYYAHAHFEDVSSDDTQMTFGENNQAFVFELLRWLGAGAKLIEPRAWREAFVDDIRAMMAVYQEEGKV